MIRRPSSPSAVLVGCAVALGACLVRAEGSNAADPTPAVASAEAAIAARIDAWLRPLDERGDLSGNLLVAIGDRIVVERSFGWADLELGVRTTPETVSNVASVTKSITLVALARLVDAGALALDDPLAKWIPDFPRGDAITVEMLATHRAGIPHRVTEDCDEVAPRTAAEVAALAARAPLDFEPGERRSYSSGGYGVLARVLERASGKTYADLVRDLVFAPAGMSRTAHVDARGIVPGRASSYYADGRGGWVHAPLKDLSFLVGAGSVFSTARDLDAFARAVRAGRYGDRARSWIVRDAGIASNGYTAGFRAFVDWHAESDLTVVWVSNLHTGAGDALRSAIPRIVAGEEVAPPELPSGKAVEIAPEVLRGFEGAYELRPGTVLQVRARDGLLVANDWTLVPVGGRRFFSPQDYAAVEVVVDEAGKPVRLDWTVAGQTFPCPRLGDPR